MEWTKPSAEMVEMFDAVAPRPPVAERRKMFGLPCSFYNGNMFMGLYQNSMVLRLPEAERQALLQVPGAMPFAPAPGRVMREYVVVPPSLLADPAQLQGWIERSLAYAQSLPEKKKKPAAKKAAAGKKAAGKKTTRR